MAAQNESTSPLSELRRTLRSRSSGYTPTEKNLALLSSQTFFSLWCYPNLYKKMGKELCDLVVVFGDDVVLFSDKEIQYKTSVNTEVEWARWYRKAIVVSANQLYRAEAWIRRYPQRIYLDAQCQKPLPLPLSDMTRTRFHRIAIANGSCDACRSYYSTRRGGLRIDSKLEGDAHLKTPFTVGRVRPDKPLVHVLDSSTLGLILNQAA